MRVIESPTEIRSLLSDRELLPHLVLCCPSCKNGNTHVKHVGTLVGGDEGTLAYEGTDPTGASPYRRSAVEIVFWCETCPKHFSLVIQQHKGNNIVLIHEDVTVKEE